MQSYPKIQRKDLVKNELDIPEIFYFLSEFFTHFIVKVKSSPPLRTARNIKGDNYICKHIARSITTITTHRPSASTRPLIKKR